MADQTEEQKRYQSNVADRAGQPSDTFEGEAEKVAPHEGQKKATRSIEGTVETTTTEKKPS